ncbi:MAG: MMPL family transporter, partial [Candidatus Kariarchaeaceae archaeon]
MKKIIALFRTQSSNFSIAWATYVIRYKWVVLIVTIATGLAAGYGGKYIRFNSDYRVFFSEDNPQLLAYDALQNKYTKDDNVFLVIESKDGQLFTQKNLKNIENLVQKAWKTPYSSRVDAVTNFQYTRAVGDELYVDDLISEASLKSDKDIERLKAIATHDSRLVNRLIDQEGKITAINLTVRLPDVDNGENREIVNYIRSIVSDFEKENSSLKTYLSGSVMMNAAFYEAATSDANFLTPLMFIIIVVTIYLTTRTITGTFSALFVI